MLPANECEHLFSGKKRLPFTRWKKVRWAKRSGWYVLVNCRGSFSHEDKLLFPWSVGFFLYELEPALNLNRRLLLAWIGGWSSSGSPTTLHLDRGLFFTWNGGCFSPVAEIALHLERRELYKWIGGCSLPARGLLSTWRGCVSSPGGEAAIHLHKGPSPARRVTPGELVSMEGWPLPTDCAWFQWCLCLVYNLVIYQHSPAAVAAGIARSSQVRSSLPGQEVRYVIARRMARPSQFKSSPLHHHPPPPPQLSWTGRRVGPFL